MQMLVRMLWAREGGAGTECEGLRRILSEEERRYKVVKPRASSVCVCVGRAAGVRESD
jgi:hypothetical protein